MGSQNEGSIQSMHPYRNNENRKVTMSTPCAALVWRIRRLGRVNQINQIEIEFSERKSILDPSKVNGGDSRLFC